VLAVHVVVPRSSERSAASRGHYAMGRPSGEIAVPVSAGGPAMWTARLASR
jgi:hypothetical protein